MILTTMIIKLKTEDKFVKNVLIPAVMDPTFLVARFVNGLILSLDQEVLLVINVLRIGSTQNQIQVLEQVLVLKLVPMDNTAMMEFITTHKTHQIVGTQPHYKFVEILMLMTKVLFWLSKSI